MRIIFEIHWAFNIFAKIKSCRHHFEMQNYWICLNDGYKLFKTRWFKALSLYSRYHIWELARSTRIRLTGENRVKQLSIFRYACASYSIQSILNVHIFRHRFYFGKLHIVDGKFVIIFNRIWTLRSYWCRFSIVESRINFEFNFISL